MGRLLSYLQHLQPLLVFCVYSSFPLKHLLQENSRCPLQVSAISITSTTTLFYWQSMVGWAFYMYNPYNLVECVTFHRFTGEEMELYRG